MNLFYQSIREKPEIMEEYGNNGILGNRCGQWTGNRKFIWSGLSSAAYGVASAK